MNNRKILAAVLIAFALGWWAAPRVWTPHKDRPGMTWLARTAKRLLWIAIVADPPPAEAEPRAQALVGEDGFRVVEHRRGW
jgi:hypothetical protein